MMNVSAAINQVLSVNNFNDLVSTAFSGVINAICWTRTLQGDFEEIVIKAVSEKNITVLDVEEKSSQRHTCYF